MLQNIHDRTKGWIAWVILSLVCVTFALWGIQSYLGNSEGMDKLATVNGINITQHQVNATYERLLQQQLNANNASQAVEQQLKQQSLQQLISSQVLSQAAIDTHYRLSENQAIDAIRMMPIFQTDGQFSLTRFKDVLNSTFYSEAGFIQDIRASMLVNQPRAGLIASAFALSNEINTLLQLMHQTRDISYLTIPVSRFLTQANVTDTAIEAFYKAHSTRFKTPEKISIEYLELSIKDVKPSNTKTAEQLFAERSEQLESLSYTHPDSLEPAAKALGLPIKKTELFSRDIKKDEKNSVYTSPKAIAAAFSTDVLNKKNNSPIIEITPDRVIVLRVKNYQAPAIQPLNAVKHTIADELKFDAAKLKAEQLGKTILTTIQKNTSKEKIAAEYGLSWTNKKAVSRDDNKIPATILNAAFSLPNPKTNFSSTDLTLPSGDVVVLLVTKITKGTSAKTTPVEQNTSYEQLTRSYGGLDYELYVRELMAKAKIERFTRNSPSETTNP